MKTDRSGEVQYAALPWRRQDGVVEVLLITSRETQRWVIPKGWPMPGLSPADAAATEAFEEAGLRGGMGVSLGTFDYEKKLKDETVRPLQVEVFPLHVESELTYWPEARERKRRWFEREAAAAVVDEPGLAEIIRRFEP